MALTVAAPGSIAAVSALEIAYTSLLVVSALVIGWFAVLVVYRLFRGQS